jgi:hypothetical protein
VISVAVESTQHSMQIRVLRALDSAVLLLEVETFPSQIFNNVDEFSRKIVFYTVIVCCAPPAARAEESLDL